MSFCFLYFGRKRTEPQTTQRARRKSGKEKDRFSSLMLLARRDLGQEVSGYVL
jgi:hypothetical protein